MTGRRARTLAGLALLALAALLGPAAGPAPVAAAPLAQVLQPLGAVRAGVSSLLWFALLRTAREDDGPRLVQVAHALLQVHPGLRRVREFLAWKLVTLARRAPDRSRHEALLAEGLWVLDEALSRGDDPQLHRALGRLLYDGAIQGLDPRFAQVVEEQLGDTPEEQAIEHLRWAGQAAADGELRSDLWSLCHLLVQRGRRVLERDRDVFRATRDLAEAEALVQRMRALDPERAQAGADTDLQRLLAPLRRELDAAGEGGP